MEASGSAPIRRLALLSLAGQLIWVVVVVVAGATEPGYSATRDAISFLGADTAARPWVFETGVAIWGLAFIAVAVALSLDAPKTLRGQLGPALIGITGVAQILVGFPFPADCRDTIDAGCEARELAGQLSWQHEAHSWAYVIGADALLLSVFAMAWRFWGDERWQFWGDRRWGRADLLTLAGAAIGVVIIIALFSLAEHGADANYGLIQRLALAAGAFWVAALAGGLLYIHRDNGEAELHSDNGEAERAIR